MTLTPVPLPTDGWLAWADEYTSSNFAEYRRQIANLKDGTPRSAGEVLELFNAAGISLANGTAPANLISEVHPELAVRELLEGRSREATELSTARSQDVELFALFAALDKVELNGNAGALRVYERTMRDFRLAGVDLPEAERERFAEIASRLTELEQDFARLARDDVHSLRVSLAQLDGLPADYVAAHPLDGEGLATITTDYPDLVPFYTFSTSTEARRALALENENRAWPANDAILAEIFSLRAEQASLAGFESWADYDTQRRMVGSAAGIEAFLDKLLVATHSAAESDYAVLLAALRAQDPAITQVDSSSAFFASELVRREEFAVDSQEARRYFDSEKVREGLLTVTSRLFGLSFVATDDPSWHSEVRVYDVLFGAETLGRIHLDLHPREGKFKHAAMFELRSGVGGTQLFEGALVCNFNRGLLEHSEVEVLFHEFGHLVHGLLASRNEWIALSGIETEWDFIEAPSQMLEEWAWDARVLQTFASNEHGELIPTELVDRMRRADAFGRGQWAARQLFLSAVSFYLHSARPADHTAYISELRTKFDVLQQLPGSHFQCSFGHLTGYSSAYYTYLWSLVIAKDLFTAFDRDDLFNESVAHRYRDLVLAPGGSKDASQLVEDFLGRPYSFDAFANWLTGE
ncbi:MAG: M3 family metallopeptidase [Acidimicrobiales bacterium]